MRGFKTYIITKKTLTKIFTLFIAVVFIIISSVIIIKKKTNAEYVAVFSNSAADILEEGTVNESSEDIQKSVLGFDVKDPISIMNSASVKFEEKEPNTPKNEEKAKPSETAPPPTQTVNELKINNATNYDVDLKEMCEKPLDFKLDMKEPEVLIVHTHTTECYNGNEMTGESERTTNEAYNMCRIGDVLSDTLNLYGIITIHNKTIHDYPSYQGSYTRALNTIEQYLKEYPSIKVVLDIHRDAYVYADGTKLRVAENINGEDVSQVMIVIGTDSMGLEHKNWRSNLAFGAKIQNTAQTLYPGLMRPINLRRERFNMHLTKGSILLEIGSNGNTLQESEKAAEYMGHAIASVLVNG